MAAPSRRAALFSRHLLPVRSVATSAHASAAAMASPKTPFDPLHPPPEVFETRYFAASTVWPRSREASPFVIQTRWLDNDIYGHVNNVQYYSFFDTVVNNMYKKNGGVDTAVGPIGKDNPCVPWACYRSSLSASPFPITEKQALSNRLRAFSASRSPTPRRW
jgi:hypothetical protein